MSHVNRVLYCNKCILKLSDNSHFYVNFENSKLNFAPISHTFILSHNISSNSNGLINNHQEGKTKGARDAPPYVVSNITNIHIKIFY